MGVRTRILVTIGLTLLWTVAAGAQPDDAQWRAFDLHGGVLSIRAPEGTIAEPPRQDNLMGPAVDQNIETRLRIPVNDTEVVVQASSLSALAPADFAAAIAASGYLDGFAGQAEVLERELGGGHMVASLPRESQVSDDTWLLAYALVGDPRGFAQEVVIASWYKPGRYDEVAGVAKAVLESLEVGATLPPLPTGETVLEHLQNGDLAVDLGGDHFISADVGPDFTVHRITSARMLGEPAAQLGVYVGNYPSMHADTADIPSDSRRNIEGRLFGEAMNWVAWDVPDGGGIIQEAIVEIPGAPGTRGAPLH
jgi:hypothetical protein